MSTSPINYRVAQANRKSDGILIAGNTAEFLIIGKALASLGFQTIMTDNLFKLLEALEHGHWDTIIIDENISDEPVNDLVAIIEQFDITRGDTYLHCLICTESSFHEDNKHKRITCPINQDELVKAIVNRGKIYKQSPAT